MGEAYRRALEEQLQAVVPGSSWHIPRTRPDETRGPGGDIISLYSIARGLADDIVVWTTVAFGLRKAWQLLKRLGNSGDPEVSEGTATAFAAEAIFDATGNKSLDFALVAPLNPHPPSEFHEPDGYVVGFRGDKSMWVATATMQGKVLSVAEVALPSELPTWWREMERWQREHESKPSRTSPRKRKKRRKKRKS